MNKLNWFIVTALIPYGVVLPISYYGMRIVFEIQTSVAYDIFGPRGFLPLWVIYILLIGCLCTIPIVKYNDWVDGNFSWNMEKKQMCYDPGLQYVEAWRANRAAWLNTPIGSTAPTGTYTAWLEKEKL